MNKKIKILVSVSAALPIPESDPRLRRTVFNFRANVDTAHFLGKLFRVLNQVLRLGGGNSEPSLEDSPRTSEQLLSFQQHVVEEGRSDPTSLPSSSSPPRHKKRSRTPKKSSRRKKNKRNVPSLVEPDEPVMPTLVADPLARYKHRCSRLSLPPRNPPPSPVPYYGDSLWSSSERVLRSITLTFLKHYPKHHYERSVESQRILVSILEMVYQKNPDHTKWTCTLAMLLLSFKDKLHTSISGGPASSTSAPPRPPIQGHHHLRHL